MPMQNVISVATKERLIRCTVCNEAKSRGDFGIKPAKNAEEGEGGDSDLHIVHE